MELQILKPVNATINIQGPVWYTQSNGAWNVLRLRKEVIDEFPALRIKRGKFFYRMIHHKSYEDLEKYIRKLKRNKEAIPILLSLYKEKEKFPN